MHRLDHERTYRGALALEQLARLRLVLCGAGAMGSHLADALVRMGVTSCRVIDRDVVEPHNAGTQLYGESEAGVAKVDALKNRLFRACGIEIDGLRQELTTKNAVKLLTGADLIIDSFDNSAARQLVQDTCRALHLPCLHVGLNADYAEIIWDEQYRVPKDVGTDVCDYPLARNLVSLAVAVAAEVTLRYAATALRESWTITLRDFSVCPVARNS